MYCGILLLFCFFFNDTATTEIYTLSLHDALPIFACKLASKDTLPSPVTGHAFDVPLIKPNLLEGLPKTLVQAMPGDRKSTRLNSSHANISYAVFCLKKKKIVILNRDTRHITTLRL